jgi:hypothetical protein
VSGVRVYRVEFDHDTPPPGWDMDMAEDHPRFASWGRSGDGYHEPAHDFIACDRDGVPWWDPPRRRHFLSKSSAAALASELEQMGVPHKLLRSLPIEFEDAS